MAHLAPSGPLRDYLCGVLAGGLGMGAILTLANALGHLAARLTLATGAPLWVGVALGPSVALLLAILAGIAVYAYGREPQRCLC